MTSFGAPVPIKGYCAPCNAITLLRCVKCGEFELSSPPPPVGGATREPTCADCNTVREAECIANGCLIQQFAPARPTREAGAPTPACVRCGGLDQPLVMRNEGGYVWWDCADRASCDARSQGRPAGAPEEATELEALYQWVISDPRTLPSDVCADVERLHALAARLAQLEATVAETIKTLRRVSDERTALIHDRDLHRTARLAAERETDRLRAELRLATVGSDILAEAQSTKRRPPQCTCRGGLAGHRYGCPLYRQPTARGGVE